MWTQPLSIHTTQRWAILSLLSFSVLISAQPLNADSVESLARQVADLEATLARIRGDDPYIVIDTARNRLTIRQNSSVVRTATCATGSGKVLLGKAGETWNFLTPRRVFSVTKKTRNPIWKKPVWAFVEKNRDAPVLPWAFERLDPNTLGAYALELENSYAIHGTLYPALLGRHITHGCVRLGDDDLAMAFTVVHVGTPVYVF